MNFMKANYLDLIFYIVFSLALCYDYFPTVFPSTPFQKWIFFFAILILFVIGLIKDQIKNSSEQNVFPAQLFFHIFSIAFIGALTFLGGESHSGISLTNPILWIVFTVSFIQIFLQRKKSKRRRFDTL
ncbi:MULTISPECIES: hypothetical protein [Heyndrickxia]|uniref:hypothetical protein n=1 Tax=Heyndrickxia TaxID=2837504 RepID=UPI0003A1E3D5|nr:hypothetical protein [Heyndrickxia oleronia]OJH18772.1 hypothetical protein BLX88_11260 [Bacillus obstructivus]MCI1591439.1 hypothetical protein [Heyndrickxia oleronia]MCI1612190.1 hypothetical protein [Heyndrickxia oleronia]MCI1745656.1 hypothetical protein [Heyndrickxia oleronia]MCI1762765.1 hypothetical protein [Heyndrickxia oleronia]